MCGSRDILLTITQLIQQNYQREQELTRTRLGYEAILFLEQTGDLRFKRADISRRNLPIFFDGERGKKDTKSHRFKRSDFDWSIKICGFYNVRVFSGTSRFKLYVSIVSVDDSTKFYRKSIFEKQ